MRWMAKQGRVLIVGATGQVGVAMGGYLRERSLEHLILSGARTPKQGSITLELAELCTIGDVAVLLQGQQLSAILCVAGWTHVDGCEYDPERAFQLNAYGPAALAGYAWEQQIPYVYFSTDYLFNGYDDAPGPYVEDAPTDPLNVYGRSKLAGETLVLGNHPEALILRTSGVYGQDEQQKNFVYQVLKRLTLGQGVRVPQDQSGTPAYNADLARATFTLLRNGAAGIYNACGPDVLDRLQFAQLIAQQFGFGTERVEGVATATLGQPALRPLRAGLDSSKLTREFPQAQMRGVVEALQDCRPALETAIAAWRRESDATA